MWSYLLFSVLVGILKYTLTHRTNHANVQHAILYGHGHDGFSVRILRKSVTVSGVCLCQSLVSVYI